MYVCWYGSSLYRGLGEIEKIAALNLTRKAKFLKEMSASFFFKFIKSHQIVISFMKSINVSNCTCNLFNIYFI